MKDKAKIKGLLPWAKAHQQGYICMECFGCTSRPGEVGHLMTCSQSGIIVRSEPFVPWAEGALDLPSSHPRGMGTDDAMLWALHRKAGRRYRREAVAGFPTAEEKREVFVTALAGKAMLERCGDCLDWRRAVVEGEPGRPGVCDSNDADAPRGEERQALSPACPALAGR